MWYKILIGTAGSIIATVAVLLTRLVFYRIRDLFPTRALFSGIAGSDSPCLVFVLRMTDLQQQGRFLSPLPSFAVASSQPQFEHRQLTPWVTSTSETQSVAHILNVLGRAGRTDNIQILFVDQDFDKWDSPMFILGGSWKASRSFETCEPYFSFRNNVFILEPTQESFRPRTNDHDIGILQKMINPATGLPVWVAMGWRGAGTNAATCALSRWWKEFGILYGNRRFGILLEMNDRDGWQQCRILRIYPEIRQYAKLLHPVAWKRISRAMSESSASRNEEETTAHAASADSSSLSLSFALKYGPKEMPPPYVKTIREEILYEYAKLISRSVFHGRINYRFVSDRFKALRDGSASMSGTNREWQREQQLPKDCVFCGAHDNLQLDHLIPRSRGGLDSADNTVWSCPACNASRGGQGIFQWLGLKKKDNLHRLVAGKYLKQLFELHGESGTLGIHKDEIRQLCPACRNKPTCAKWGKEQELTCFCLESMF